MDKAAKSSGLGKRATLIKFCVKVFLDDLEDRGERTFPRDWKAIVKSLDNRTAASRVAAMAGGLTRFAENLEKKMRGGKTGGKK